MVSFGMLFAMRLLVTQVFMLMTNKSEFDQKDYFRPCDRSERCKPID